jgi:signal transduction histidine kinase
MFNVFTQSISLSLVFATIVLLALGLSLVIRERRRMPAACIIGYYLHFGLLLSSWIFLCVALPAYHFIDPQLGTELATWHLRLVPIESLGIVLWVTEVYAAQRNRRLIRLSTAVFTIGSFFLSLVIGGAGIMPDLIGFVYPAAGTYDIFFYFLPNIAAYILFTYYAVRAWRRDRKPVDRLGIFASLSVWGYVLGGLAISVTNNGHLFLIDFPLILLNTILIIVFFLAKCSRVSTYIQHPWRVITGRLQLKLQLLFGLMLFGFMVIITLSVVSTYIYAQDIQQNNYARLVDQGEQRYFTEVVSSVSGSADELATAAGAVGAGELSRLLRSNEQMLLHLVDGEGRALCEGCPWWQVDQAALKAGTQFSNVDGLGWSAISMTPFVPAGGGNAIAWAVAIAPYGSLARDNNRQIAGPLLYEGLVSREGRLINSYGAQPDREYLSAMLAAEAAGERVQVPKLFDSSLVELRDTEGVTHAYLYRYYTQAERDRWTMLVVGIAVNAGILVGIIILLLAWRMLRLLVTPVRQLRTAAETVRSGSYDVNVDVSSVDELGQMAKTFNKMARSIEVRTTELEEKNREQQDFLNYVAHELKTPISAVRWSLEMLEEDESLPDEQNEILDTVGKANKRMGLLVTDLLEFARLERGAIKLIRESFEMRSAVDAALDALEEHARQRNIRCEVSGGLRNLPEVSGDRKRAEQILINIIGNAIKYSPEVGSRVDIKLQRVSQSGPRGRKGKFIRVAVCDHGIGIPADQQKLIFGKFFRAKNAVVSGIEGSGFGLHVSQRILSMMGGDMWFKSVEGRGTTFWITMPI